MFTFTESKAKTSAEIEKDEDDILEEMLFPEKKQADTTSPPESRKGLCVRMSE